MRNTQSQLAGYSLQQIRGGTGWPRGARFRQLTDEARRRPTAREVEVAQCVADGLTMDSAAARLGIAVKTARTHAQNLMRLLGVHSIAHAVAIGVREGWLS